MGKALQDEVIIMRIKMLFVLPIIMGLILADGTARADALYTLSPGSTFQEGCVFPCMCPVGLPEVVTGTFLLVPAGSDPLFTNYNLDMISWTVLDSSGGVVHQITGQGFYRLGGEVALTQQLTLDLNVDGGSSQHFDSGLIVGGSDFPSISISVSRGSSCFNIWVDIKASPQQNGSFIATLENPANGQKVSGNLPIYGWALDQKGITKIELFIDDQLIGNIPYGGIRLDVKNLYPNFPDAEDSGFAMIWHYSTLSSGDHSVKVRVYNQDGQTKDLDALFTVKKFHGESVEKISPSSRLLRNNSVTADGVTQKYDIRIEWSNILQGFEIIEIIQKQKAGDKT
jgi:hypothetical protein